MPQARVHLLVFLLLDGGQIPKRQRRNCAARWFPLGKNKKTLEDFPRPSADPHPSPRVCIIWIAIYGSCPCDIARTRARLHSWLTLPQRKQVELRPTSADALSGYAAFLMVARGEYREAETLLERAIEGQSSHVGALSLLSMLHSEHTGNGEAAERYAALAMASSPGDARALTAHAACLEKRGDADAAEEAHRQAVKSPGAGPLSFSRFAAFMERRGMKEVSLELYREALQQDEGDAETAYRCGRLLASMNDAESRSEAVGLIRMAAAQVIHLAPRILFLIGTRDDCCCTVQLAEGFARHRRSTDSEPLTQLLTEFWWLDRAWPRPLWNWVACWRHRGMCMAARRLSGRRCVPTLAAPRR